MKNILNEMKDMVFILLVTGIFSWGANLINIHPDLAGSAVGVFFLVVLATIGIFLSKLPLLGKLPMVFWVSIVAVVVSIPGFPGGAFVLSYTKQVSFIALTTPLLAYVSSALPFWPRSCCTLKVYSDSLTSETGDRTQCGRPKAARILSGPGRFSF